MLQKLHLSARGLRGEKTAGRKPAVEVVGLKPDPQDKLQKSAVRPTKT